MAQELQRKLEKVAPDRADLGLAYAGLGEAASGIAEGQNVLAIATRLPKSPVHLGSWSRRRQTTR